MKVISKHGLRIDRRESPFFSLYIYSILGVVNIYIVGHAGITSPKMSNVTKAPPLKNTYCESQPEQQAKHECPH